MNGKGALKKIRITFICMAVYLDSKACWLLFLLLLLISAAGNSHYPELISNAGELERPGNHKVGICPEIRPSRRPSFGIAPGSNISND